MDFISDYFRSLERHLDCPRSVRRPFLTQTKQMAEDFMQGKPDATPQEVTDYLGEPGELARGFVETLDQTMLERYRRRKRILLCGGIAVLIVALIGAGIWGLYLWNMPMHVEITEVLIY